jgi:rare lipoprotein A
MQLPALIPLLLLCALLTGCPKPAPHSSAPDHATLTPAQLPNGAGGIRKTGNPYNISGRWYTPMTYENGYDETGVASWYGRDFHGKRTANGEIYDMHALSAAHKTLPLPTLVRVTNLDNGRMVIVRVNDRGPFVKDRLIDLSYAAAKTLGFARNGTAHVRVQSLELPPPSKQQALAAGAKLRAADHPNSVHVSAPDRLSAPASSAAGKIFIQLGAFGSKANAEHLQQQLKGSFSAIHTVAVELGGKRLYRVRIGPFDDMVNIEQTVAALQQHGFDKPIVVIE